MFRAQPWLVVFALLAPAAVASAARSPGPTKGSPCDRPECRQFDFWIGDWDVFGPDGRTVIGRSHIETILDGCVVLENWYGSKGGTGKSFNVWTRSDSLWHQAWVSNTGNQLLLVGSYHDGRMVLEGASPPGTQNRITYEPQPNGEMVQRWDVSADGGSSWKMTFLGTYRKKQP